MPDVPTVAERGFPGFEAGSWFGFFAPKGTPHEVVATLNTGGQRDHRGAGRRGGDGRARAPTRSAARRSSSAQFVQREFEKWRAVVHESGAVAE